MFFKSKVFASGILTKALIASGISSVVTFAALASVDHPTLSLNKPSCWTRSNDAKLDSLRFPKNICIHDIQVYGANSDAPQAIVTLKDQSAAPAFFALNDTGDRGTVILKVVDSKTNRPLYVAVLSVELAIHGAYMNADSVVITENTSPDLGKTPSHERNIEFIRTN